MWVYGDNFAGATVGQQYKNMMRLWMDPNLPGLAIEGVRIYSTVFRCAALCDSLRRDLYVGVLLQDYDVGRAHVRARCAKGRKRFREEFWDDPERKVQSLFNSRYLGGVRKFRREHPQAPLVEVREFWIDEYYQRLDDVRQWLDARLALL